MTSIQAPSFIRAALAGARPVQLTFGQVSKTNTLSTTSSFMYDPPGSPLKSTQQLNIDWSQFDRHTFFNSAAAKVNVAFDQIINGYPFDGTRIEVESFFEKLTGFDKWVFDQFPKYKGALHFSGTQIGEDTNGTKGTFIVVNDYAGGLFPELSKTKTGQNTLDPQGAALSIEMQLYVPEKTNGVQIICQKQTSSTYGFTVALRTSSTASVCDAQFSLYSGSSVLTANAPIQKGRYSHVCATYHADERPQFVRMYVNSELNSTASQSTVSKDLGILDIESAQFTVGSGSAFFSDAGLLTPTQTLSGVLDELRIFHSTRTPEQQKRFAQKNVYASDDLKLYYKFNEPVGPLTPTVNDAIDAIILDSSGRSLHALVSNFTSSLRINTLYDSGSLMTYERLNTSPILFPSHTDVVSLNETLLTSGSDFDTENPNIITKLIPAHYFLEGQLFDGLESIDGSMSSDNYSGRSLPGSGIVGNTQYILAFLYIWARFFDEIKLYVDSFANLRHVDYDQNETTPDAFLLKYLTEQGFVLPPILFNDASIEQFIDAENIQFNISTNEFPLQYIQNQLIRRVLINMPDIVRSKGTLHAIKSFFRTIGIDPDNSIRMREYGGPTKQSLSFARELKRSVMHVLSPTSGSLIRSPFLVATRTEPGFPKITGNSHDSFLTSGSWTCETIVRYTPVAVAAMSSSLQSLFRLNVTGSGTSNGGVIFNLVASPTGTTIYGRPGGSSTSPFLSLSLPYAVFDNNDWKVSFGCERGDAIQSPVSSSYFLRMAYENAGQIIEQYVTSSFFMESPTAEINALRSGSTVANVSGTYFSVGSNQTLLTGSASGYLYLNNTTSVPNSARTTTFEGTLSNMRFWSKALAIDEWVEHVKNPKSTGVEDPLKNWDYVTSRSGSFERLRLHTVTKQNITSSDSTGYITFFDMSGGNLHATGSGFPANTKLLFGELVDHSNISPYFDEASTNEKIRIRSYESQDLVDATPWAQVAPVYEIPRNEHPTDDVRFSVEFSLVDALNRDIISMFSTLDALDNALGAPELVYSPDYPDLDRLRDVYFHRLTEKINFKAFFEFFRWFDAAAGNFIEQLLPKKVSFKGVNFVIESHMLERHKVEYFSSDIYLQENDRNNINDQILLQQIAGVLRKW